MNSSHVATWPPIAFVYDSCLGGFEKRREFSQMSIKGLNMAGPHHICILYVATAGLQGPLMGSDEQEIVLLIYVIVDVIQNKVSRIDLID